jgi:FkbM family methyltransferase
MSSSFESLLLKVFSPLAYCRFKQATSPIFRASRRGNITRFEQDAVSLIANDGKRRLRFFAPLRCRKYIGPQGTQRAIDRLGAKYAAPWGCEVGGVVVDIGSNVGEFALFAAPKCDRVICIEPDPSLGDILAHNVSPFSNVEVHKVAAGDSDGEVTFYLSTGSADSSVIEPESYTSRVVVPVRRLDSLFHEIGVDRIDLLKVEAEGFEPEVLRSLAGFRGEILRVAVDAGPERKGQPTADECHEILEAMGFRVWSEKYQLYAEKAGAEP